MPKQEYQMTPLEVEKVATERLTENHPWALAVAQQIIESANLSEFPKLKKNKDGSDEKFHEKYPLFFESLHNRVAEHLIRAAGYPNRETFDHSSVEYKFFEDGSVQTC